MQKMREKEAKDIIYMWAMERASDGDVEACEAFDMAIKALEELNQYKQGGLVLIPADVYQRQCDELDAYKAIGTVEEIDQKLAELARWHTNKINKNIKNVFAYTSTLICHNCDHKDDYIEELEAEVAEYRAIGTVEEVKQLKENAFTGNELAIIASNLIVLRDYQSIGTVEELQKVVKEEDVLKFYYIESEDKYVVGQRVGNFYYAEIGKTGLTWYMSRYLPWGEHVVSPTTAWKEHTYPSEPKEIPFFEWLQGFIKKRMW